MSSNPVVPAVDNSNENVLYVVLHGLISLVDNNHDGFVAHVLEIGDQHTYMFGNWLLEKDIPKRKFGQVPMRAELLGVNPGVQTLDPQLNLIVKVPAPPSDTDVGIRAVFLLPRPRQIYYFISGEIERGTLQGDLTKLLAPPSRISGIRVFEYSFSDPQRVFLRSEDKSTIWVCPDLVPLDDRNVAALHIYDEPLESLPFAAVSQHNIDEFNLSLKFFAAPLTLTKTAQNITPAQATIPGLLPGEVAALDQRTPFVFGLLRDVRNPKLIGQPTGTGGGTGGQVCSGCHAVVTP